MNKNFVAFALVVLLHESAFSQKAEHVNGGAFTKTIEYNVAMAGVKDTDCVYNLKSKSVVDRIFFGVTNSPVEFVLETAFDGASAFRIVNDASGGVSAIEVMSLPDSEKLVETVRILSAQVNPIHIPGGLLNSTSLTMNDMEKIGKHNKIAATALYDDSLYKPYRPKAISFKVSNELSEKLYAKMKRLIDGFKAEGIPPIIADGYSVTFRCVVEDELWTLRIAMPQDKALLLSDICRQILTDAQAGRLDESKYLKSLDQLNF